MDDKRFVGMGESVSMQDVLNALADKDAEVGASVTFTIISDSQFIEVELVVREVRPLTIEDVQLFPAEEGMH